MRSTTITVAIVMLGLALPASAGLVEKAGSPDTGRMLRHPSGIAPDAPGAPHDAGDFRNPLLLAQQQPSEKDIEEAKKNLGVIKKRLDDRQSELDRRAEAIRKEREELARIKGGQTLRGSRADAYLKRVADVNQMQETYNADYNRLQNDIETYNAAVNEMKDSVTQSAQPPDAQGNRADDSAQDLSKREAVKTRIEEDRRTMADNYKALMEEKQRIMAQQSSGQSGAAFQQGRKTTVPFDEQIRQWNDKMREYAKQRNAFNDAVKSFNATTGENIATIPAP